METPIPSPTQEAMAAAVKTVDLPYSDQKGDHKVTIRKPSTIAQYRFIEMLGPLRAANSTYVGMSIPVIYVTAIDGESVTQPAKYSEFEALIQRLDEAGLAAVAKGIEEHFGGVTSPQEGANTIKK